MSNTRSWVSGTGNDANAGSRTSRCATFAGALVKTLPGGEINVLDPGGFGPVTVNKAVTIDGGQAFAGITAAGTVNGITVRAGPADVVILRHLTINGQRANTPAAADGIRFDSGAALIIGDGSNARISKSAIEWLRTGSWMEPSALCRAR